MVSKEWQCKTSSDVLPICICGSSGCISLQIFVFSLLIYFFILILTELHRVETVINVAIKNISVH